MMENGLQAVLRYLPVPVRSAVQQMPAEVQTQIQEVRLRAEKPVAVVIQQQERFLAPDGTRTQQPAKALRMSQRTLEQTFQAVCSYSVYCYAREIVRALLPWTAGIVWELPALRCIGTAFSHRCTTSPDSTFAFHTASRDVQKSCTGRLAAADLRASCSPVQSAPERPPCCGTCAGCSGRTPCFSH